MEPLCHNRGSCSINLDTPSCSSPKGLVGFGCEINEVDCQTNPCVLGDCTDGVGASSCACPEGSTDKNYECEIDACAKTFVCVPLPVQLWQNWQGIQSNDIEMPVTSPAAYASASIADTHFDSFGSVTITLTDVDSWREALLQDLIPGRRGGTKRGSP